MPFKDRRSLLRVFWGALAYLSCVPFEELFSQSTVSSGHGIGDIFRRLNSSNFKAIYENERERAEFYKFLENVYKIYPSAEFHAEIATLTHRLGTDADIYNAIQKQLPSIKPFLSELTFSLPALSKQKHEIRSETVSLLDRKKYDGYLEIGTLGRHTSDLKVDLSIEGPIYLMNSQDPGYSPVDIAERGSLFKVGKNILLSDYSPIKDIAPESLDLVTNYIGFHHATVERLDPFVGSVCGLLRKGGRLILRDHQVNSPEMYAMVALAHDVFNAGLNVPWSVNAAEVRNFRSLEAIQAHLLSYGLRRGPKSALQSGDPTINTLMMFEKIA